MAQAELCPDLRPEHGNEEGLSKGRKESDQNAETKETPVLKEES
jgi:hypothetical protein